jgi:DNA-binding NarL/FixJ family response regulator
VEIAARGGSLLDPSVTQIVMDWIRRNTAAPAASSLGGLSEQERNVLLLVAEGRTNREIAAELALSEHTVKTYVSHIFQKLNLSRRTEAAALLYRLRHPERLPPPE